ncbi:MAG: signal peptidase I [Rhodothermales bacterium]
MSTPPKRTQAPPSPFRLRDGLKILGIALLVALGVRTVILEGFRIPTESMEKSLLVGDFVLVSKVHYGARLPMTIGVPLTNWYLPDVELPYLRLPGFSDIKRGDAIVFNYPVEMHPVDRKQHYIKRVVALPGDSIALHDKQLYVNGSHVPLSEAMQQRWIASVSSSMTFPFDSIRALGASQVSPYGRARDRVSFEATPTVADVVASWSTVDSVEPYMQSLGIRIFPPGSGFDRDHYGPIRVPARGDTLTLSGENWLMYRDLVRRFEGHEARFLPDGTIEIDGERRTTYVVEQDYYFVLGDNRDSSVDSRVWGFVPMTHVVGKAVLVYFSWEAEKRRVRSERLFKGIE